MKFNRFKVSNSNRINLNYTWINNICLYPLKPQPAYISTNFLGLNYLRVFAITYVFLFHYQIFGHPDWVNRIGQFGWTGVDLFLF